MKPAAVFVLGATLVGCATSEDKPTSASAAPASESVSASPSASGVSLRGWMKANAIPALAAEDGRRLKGAFDRIAELGPSGYASWTSIARDGAASAARADIDGCRAACRQCHEEYRSPYRSER